jgi:enoyl-CoA hydratase
MGGAQDEAAQALWRMAYQPVADPAAQRVAEEMGALDLARRMCQGAPVALEKTKEAMVCSSGLSLEEAFAVETRCTKENAMMDDAREGPRAFMEKRPPVFRGRAPR